MGLNRPGKGMYMIKFAGRGRLNKRKKYRGIKPKTARLEAGESYCLGVVTGK